MYLIQLYLPLNDNKDCAFSGKKFLKVEQELTEKFGGLTAYTRAPADGFWKPDKETVAHDNIITFEIMTEEIDSAWWQDYHATLAIEFSQQEIMILATSVVRL